MLYLCQWKCKCFPRRGTWSACAPALIAAAGAQRHVCGGKRGGLDLAPLRKQRALQNKAWIRQRNAGCLQELLQHQKLVCDEAHRPPTLHWAVGSFAGLQGSLMARSFWLCFFVELLFTVPVRRKAVPSAAEVLWLSASNSHGSVSRPDVK